MYFVLVLDRYFSKIFLEDKFVYETNYDKYFRLNEERNYLLAQHTCTLSQYIQ